MGNGGRPNHLVLDPVAQVTFVHIKRHPTHHILQTGFGEDIGDRVAHSQIGGYRAVENTLEHREYISGCTADIDADHLDVLQVSDGLHNRTDRTRGGHDRRISPRHQFLVPGCLLHHMFQEQVMDRLAGGQQVFPFQHRSQVVDNREIDLLFQCLLDQLARFLVAGINNRQVVAGTKTRFRIGGADQFGDFDDMSSRAAINTAGEQDHIGTQVANPFDLLVWLPLVIGGDYVHHNGAGTQGGAFR